MSKFLTKNIWCRIKVTYILIKSNLYRLSFIRNVENYRNSIHKIEHYLMTNINNKYIAIIIYLCNNYYFRYALRKFSVLDIRKGMFSSDLAFRKTLFDNTKLPTRKIFTALSKLLKTLISIYLFQAQKLSLMVLKYIT